MKIKNAKRYPATAKDYKFLIYACNELIAYSEVHEDADDRDRAPMKRAMRHVGKRLDTMANEYCRRQFVLNNPGMAKRERETSKEIQRSVRAAMAHLSLKDKDC